MNMFKAYLSELGVYALRSACARALPVALAALEWVALEDALPAAAVVC